MSKYIDLAEQIHAETRDQVYLDEVGEVLDWLDRNPDQVPGLTITASEFDEAVESCITEDGTVPPHEFAERLGVVCVPDPEPTNVGKLETEIRELLQEPSQSFSIARDLAEKLDTAGWTKAPGGDDE